MIERFKTQPTLLSLVIFAAVIGLCGGSVGGLLWSIKFFIEGEVQSGLIVLFGSPIAQAVQFAVVALLAYPLLSVWTKRVQSMTLEGERIEQRAGDDSL